MGKEDKDKNTIWPAYKAGQRISVRTPLMWSKPLSNIANRCVYLKLECVQPSGSFKLRGISHLCKTKYAEGCTKMIGASGGNAGLALAYASEKLGVPCKIYVPLTVLPRMMERMKSHGAEVVVGGKDIQDASELALAECQEDPKYAYVHPYDNPLIWEGHSNIIPEMKEDLKGRKPAAIALSVGGGGMLMGILIGMEKVGWEDVPIVALETEGCECFNLSLKEDRIVDVAPTSIAKTLGCRTPAAEVLKMAKKFNIISKVLPDKDAAAACVLLADHHGIMVEPSCGVTLASVYNKVIPDILENNKYDSKSGPIVLIVCGGSDMTAQTLMEYREKYMQPEKIINGN